MIKKTDVEAAIASWKECKNIERRNKAELEKLERTIEVYAREHIGDFKGDKLLLDNGTIVIKSGIAKPIKDGKPLTTSERLRLATILPSDYVKLTCDYSALFKCEDKKIREVLSANKINIVREDRYALIF